MTRQNSAQARSNKIIATAWTGLGAKVVTIAASVVMVPLSVHYLGEAQYGLWVAVSSMVAMLGFMDGGVGNAVINMVAHASGAKREDMSKIVSTAFFSLMVLALLGGLLFFAIFPFISWGKLLGVSEPTSLTNLNTVVLLVGLFFFVNIFTTLVGKIQRGLQEGNLDNFWNGVSAVLSLIFVYVAIRRDAGLVGFVIAFLSGPLLAYTSSNIHYLLIRRRDLRPRLINVETNTAKNLFTVGGMFFVMQMAGIIQGQADNVIISNMLGPAAVTDYAVCMKLFLMVPALFGLLLAPLWPAYREAVASNDMQWVKQVFLKSMKWALLISIPSALVLVLFGGIIIELWVGKDAIPSTGLLVGCGIWMVFCTVGGAMAALLNSLQFMKLQVTVAIVSGFVNIALTILLIPIAGAEGAVFGSAIAWFFCSVPPYYIALKKFFSRGYVP